MKDLNLNKEERETIINCLCDYMGSCDFQLKTKNNSLDKSVKKEFERRISFCSKMVKKIENSMKKIKVSSAKSKGRSFQYWVCEKIGKLIGIEFIPSNDDCLIQSRPMGLNGVDVVLRGEAKKKFPFSVECKACENLSISEWIKQAKNNIKEGEDWLLAIKKQSVGNPFVVMDWETFERILRNNV